MKFILLTLLFSHTFIEIFKLSPNISQYFAILIIFGFIMLNVCINYEVYCKFICVFTVLNFIYKLDYLKYKLNLKINIEKNF